MTDVVVHRAVLLPGPTGEGRWRLHLETNTGEDGAIEHGIALLPADTLEWRMAQFNVDAETAANLMVSRHFTGVKDNVYDDETTRSAARALAVSHMEQATTVTWGAPKGKGVAAETVEPDPDAIADSVEGGDPLATIVEHSPVDDDVIAVKREWLDTKRAERRARQERRAARKVEGDQRRAAGERPTLRRRSAEQLREQLIESRRPRPPVESSGPADIRRTESHRRDS